MVENVGCKSKDSERIARSRGEAHDLSGEGDVWRTTSLGSLAIVSVVVPGSSVATVIRMLDECGTNDTVECEGLVLAVAPSCQLTVSPCHRLGEAVVICDSSVGPMGIEASSTVVYIHFVATQRHLD